MRLLTKRTQFLLWAVFIGVFLGTPAAIVFLPAVRNEWLITAVIGAFLCGLTFAILEPRRDDSVVLLGAVFGLGILTFYGFAAYLYMCLGLSRIG